MRVDDDLRREIVAAVQAVEKGSAAEVVVTVVPRSAAHWDVSLSAALAAVFLIQSVGWVADSGDPVTITASYARTLAGSASPR